MTSIAILTIAYREERFIAPFIKHYKDYVDDILVLNSSKPYQGEDTNLAPDHTNSIALELGATVIKTAWPTETEQRNFGLKMLQEHDWVLILDPDEYYLKQDLPSIKQYLKSSSERAFVTGAMNTYWKKGYRIFPPEGHTPVVAVRPQSVKFTGNRGVGCTYGRLPSPFLLHHFSWARTDGEVLQKVSHYSHSPEFNTRKWFDEKWMKWTPEMQNFHPTHPEQYRQAIPVEYPEELQHLGEF